MAKFKGIHYPDVVGSLHLSGKMHNIKLKGWFIGGILGE